MTPAIELAARPACLDVFSSVEPEELEKHGFSEST